MTDSFSGDVPKVRNISSSKPFALTALEYYRHGWFPIPLPPKDKFPPPKDTTGRKNPIPDDRLAAITEFLKDFPEDSNVGLRLDQTVIGIDVDNYDAKHGARELAELEQKHGKLPRTWISTARTDGDSGIRFFRIPKKFWPGTELGGEHGLSFSGKAANAIEVVQYVHRYAAVGPSYHPKAGEYHWFTPEENLTDSSASTMQVFRGLNKRVTLNGEVAYRVTLTKKIVPKIPYIDDLPELPDAWVEYLSRGFVRDDLKPRDITSTEKDLISWAAKHFPGGRNGAPCKTVRKASATHKKMIQEEEASHNRIIGVHWNLFNYALEGHRGALKSSRFLEGLWQKSVLKGNAAHGQKRFLSEAGSEMFRSRVEALRKIKGEADAIVEVGGDPFRTGCTCHDEEASKREMEAAGLPTGIGQIKDLEEYDHSDRGRAEIYRDMFTTERIKVVGEGENAKWFFWKLDGTEFGWRQDNDLAVRLVETISKSYKTKYHQLLQRYREQKISDHPDLALTKAEMGKYRQLYEGAGNASTARNCLSMLGTLPDIRVGNTYFDSRPELLGFEDGLVELIPGKPWKFRNKEFEDRVSLSVGRAFEGHDLNALIAANDPGVLALIDYKRTFVPDDEVWKFIQVILGYSLYGENPSRKIFFFHGESSTGKSMLVNALYKSLGPYGGSSGSDVFNDKDGGRNPELMKVMGKRMVQLPEFGEGTWITNDAMKRLASQDPISVRDNYAKSDQIMEFEHTATFIGPTNSVPKINGIDSAVRARLVAVPFDQVMPEKQRDDKKANFLSLHGRDAILAWALEGWNMYSASGGKLLHSDHWPAPVKARTHEFIGEMSSIGEFVEDYIEVTDDNKDRLSAKLAYDYYEMWADSQGLQKKMDQRKLSRSISDFTGKKSAALRTKSGVVRGWAGVRLREGSTKINGRGFGGVNNERDA